MLRQTLTKQVVASVALIAVFVIGVGLAMPPASTNWLARIAGPGIDRPTSVANDNIDRSTYITGFTQSPTYLSLPALGRTDGFLAKFSQLRGLIWAERIGGPGDDALTDMAIAANGDLYAVGYTTSALVEGLQTKGFNDGLLFKYDKFGGLRWVRAFSGLGNDTAHGVALDSNGDVFVTGTTNSPDLNGISGVGREDIFVTKFDEDGHHLWTRRFGGSNPDLVTGIAVAPNGSIAVSGFTASQNFLGAPSIGTSYDGFVVKLDAMGQLEWHDRFDNPGLDWTADVAVDGLGGIHVVGNVLGATFDTNTTIQGGSLAFHRKYSPLGTIDWQNVYDGDHSDLLVSVSIDTDDLPLLTGQTNSSDLAGKVALNTPGGAFDGFVSRTLVDGSLDWALRVAGGGDDLIVGAAKDNGRRNILVGITQSAEIGGQVGGTEGDLFINQAWEDPSIPSTPTPLPTLTPTPTPTFAVPLWTIRFETMSASAYDEVHGLVGDNRNNLIAAGVTQSAIFGGKGGFGGQDVFVTRLSNRGTRLWTRVLGTMDDEYATGVTTGPTGNIFITGDFLGSAFQGNNRIGGPSDFFVAMLSSTGTPLWSINIGGGGEDRAFDIASTRTEGELYVACATNSRSIFGKFERGGLDIGVAKVDPAGSLLNFTRHGTPNHDVAHAVVADRNGSLAVTGYADFNGTIGSDMQLVVLSIDLSGSIDWTGHLDGDGDDVGYDVALAGNGDIVVVGSTSSTDIQGQTGSGMDDDILVARYSSGGVLRWVFRLAGGGVPGDDVAKTVVVDASSNIYVAGYTDSGDLDGQPTNGGRDEFLLKLDENATLQWVTVRGGANDDELNTLAFDFVGELYGAGFTNSDPFGTSTGHIGGNDPGDGYVTGFSAN